MEVGSGKGCVAGVRGVGGVGKGPQQGRGEGAAQGPLPPLPHPFCLTMPNYLGEHC